MTCGSPAVPVMSTTVMQNTFSMLKLLNGPL
jgi:hypothetical protein